MHNRRGGAVEGRAPSEEHGAPSAEIEAGSAECWGNDVSGKQFRFEELDVWQRAVGLAPMKSSSREDAKNAKRRFGIPLSFAPSRETIIPRDAKTRTEFELNAIF